MAIARVTSGSARGAGSNTQTISSLAVGTPSNGLLLAFAASANDDITGITFGGTPMTLIQKNTDANSYITVLYGLLAPSGTGNVVVTQGDLGYMTLIAVAYSGANQSLTLDAKTINNAGAGASTLATSITVVGTGCWVSHFDAVGNIQNSVTNGTVFVNSSIGICNATTGPDTACYDSNGTVSSGSNTLTANFCASTTCNTTLISIAPAAGTGPANLKTYNTNVKANIKTMNTNPFANVKTFDTNS